MEAVYLLRRVMEQYHINIEDLHLFFIDLEKACERVHGEILWKFLEKKGAMIGYIRDIKNTYKGASTSVRMHDTLVLDCW